MKKYNKDFTEENINETLKDNTLGRNQKLISLVKILNSMEDNYIISLDGVWGSGKTFFVKQLMYLKKYMDMNSAYNNSSEKKIVDEFDETYFIVYYNAWENDDHKNPLESIIYSILNILPEYKDIFVEGEMTELFKNTVRNFVEMATAGILKKEDIKNSKTYSELADSVNTIEEKKQCLNELINQLTQNKRLLLVVDELDRCKPDYAVNMIETLKHFYNNPNISIIVATNNMQLSNTIKKFYGESFDGYGYLNKIYDVVVTLNIDSISEYTRAYLGIGQHTNLPEDFTIYLFKKMNFSYRECNSYMSMYDIVLPYIKYRNEFSQNDHLAISCIFVPLTIALKVKNISKYENFVNGAGEEIIEEIFNEDMVDKYKSMYNWLCEVFKKKPELELYKMVITKYQEIFNSKEFKFNQYPFMEAISMIGPLVYLEN